MADPSTSSSDTAENAMDVHRRLEELNRQPMLDAELQSKMSSIIAEYFDELKKDLASKFDELKKDLAEVEEADPKAKEAEQIAKKVTKGKSGDVKSQK